MSTASDIYSALSGSSAVSALVGTRIYRNLAPQSAVRPFVLYKRIKGGGAVNSTKGHSGLDNPHYYISCWVETNMDDAYALADKVKTALESAMPKSIYLGVYDGEPEYPLNIYGAVLEYSIWEHS